MEGLKGIDDFLLKIDHVERKRLFAEASIVNYQYSIGREVS